MVKPTNVNQTIAPAVADPNMDSYFRWLNATLDTFRKVCRSEKVISQRIIFLHRKEGHWSLCDEEIGNKIDRALLMQQKIFDALGKKDNESLDLFHQRMVETKRNKVAITMANLGAVEHWQPPMEDYGLRNKSNPRRPMTEQAMNDRMRDAENFAVEFT